MQGLWLVIALAIAAASWPTASGAQPSPPAAKPVPASPPAAPKPKSPQRVPAPSAVPAGDAKVIKRPAEYNAYIAALNLADPVRKAAAMEAFIIKYPASVVKIDALEQAMAAYQAAGNVTQVEDAANRILMTQPRNVRALAIVTFLRRARATQGDAKALADMPGGAELGLQGLQDFAKPSEMNDAAFAGLRQQMTGIFHGALGFAAVQAKDYRKAREHYEIAVEANPTGLQDVYQLAIAELQMEPIDPTGFWYIAKAVNIAKDNDAAQQSIAAFGKSKYQKFHGSADGWDALLASAAAQSSPPAGFASSIKARPTLAELAVAAVRDNDPAELSFDDWEVVLSLRDASPANKQAAAVVWQAIQAKQKDGTVRLRIAVMFIMKDGEVTAK